MRVLTLINCYPPHYYGGYELTCRDVMDRFRQAGHDVTVLASDARVPGVSDAPEPHVHRALTPYWDWEAGHRNIPSTLAGRAHVERRNLAALRTVLAETRPDVVSVWHMLALSLSLLTVVRETGIPAVVTVANDWLIDGPSYDGWLRLWQRWPFHFPAAVAGVPTRPPELAGTTVNFVSAFTKVRTLERSTWTKPIDAPIVQPGVDLSDFPLSAPVDRDWRWRILYVGRIDQTKGVATLVRAFATLPATATLDLLGGGSVGYQADIRALAAQLGVAGRVTIDRVARGELRGRYRDADVVVFPSEWDEPFGLVPLEAMACGVPVVATGTGGSGEFLEHGSNSVLFRAGDVTALATAVRSLAEDRVLRQRLCSGGRATAERLTIDRYAAELLELHVQARQAEHAARAR